MCKTRIGVNQKRPPWKMYFMMLANIARTRSLDLNSKHGCVIVNKNNKIVSMGYNSFPSGFPDEKLPLTRPEKYAYMVHAEINAILATNDDLSNCTLYVTGYPCVNCLQAIVQKDIKHIVCFDYKSKMLNGTYPAVLRDMSKYGGIKIETVPMNEFRQFLDEFNSFWCGKDFVLNNDE